MAFRTSKDVPIIRPHTYIHTHNAVNEDESFAVTWLYVSGQRSSTRWEEKRLAETGEKMRQRAAEKREIGNGAGKGSPVTLNKKKRRPIKFVLLCL